MSDEIATVKEFSKLAEARSKIYGFLSLIYVQPPNNNLVQKILDSSFQSFLTSLILQANIPKEMMEGVKIIEDFLGESKNALLTELREKLSVEYTRLFRGVKRFYGPPPPYESMYAEKGLVMGESAVKVSEEYAKAGVAIPNQHKGEPPDYIGFELDFMRYLCSEESSAWKSRRFNDAKSLLEKQKTFINEHLIRWVPNFCDKVLEEAEIEFYRGIAKITKGFVKFESNQLNILINIAEQIKPKRSDYDTFHKYTSTSMISA